MRKTRWLAFALVALLFGGCIVSDTSHTLFLSPDGSVTWLVLERNVRSNEDEPLKREREERDFLRAFESGTHPIALAFTALFPRSIERSTLRNGRPFVMATTARFDSIDRMLEAMFQRAGVPVRVFIDRNGDETRLELLAKRTDLEEDAEGDDSDLLTPLFSADREDYEIVLTEGRFVHAVGFEIADSADTARIGENDLDDLTDEHGEVRLFLSWTTAEKPDEK